MSIVVFNNEADLKVYVNNYIVVNRYYLNDALLQYKETVISPELKTKIISRIEASNWKISPQINQNGMQTVYIFRIIIKAIKDIETRPITNMANKPVKFGTESSIILLCIM